MIYWTQVRVLHSDIIAAAANQSAPHSEGIFKPARFLQEQRRTLFLVGGHRE